jgi:hypothetical protein
MTLQELAENYDSEIPAGMTPEGEMEAQMPGEVLGARAVMSRPNFSTVAPGAPLDLAGMLARYQGAGTNAYGSELKTAREAAATETKSFNDLITKAMAQKTEPPSKAEMYFRLASAFGTPTKTGSFFEGLGNAGTVMSDYNKEARAARATDIARVQQLGVAAQQARMGAAREDVNTLRTLTAEEMKDTRATQLELLKQYIASGKPQSDAGKAAVDAGLVQGTPEFTAFVKKFLADKIESGNLLKEVMASVAFGNLTVAKDRLQLSKEAGARQEAQSTKLTPGEVQLRTATEDQLAGTNQAVANLRRAYMLNEKSFDTSYADTIQRRVLEEAKSKDPKLANTKEMENLLEKAALSQLKETFPGAISDAERAALLATQGLAAKSKEERARIMKNAYTALQTVQRRAQKRLSDIQSGTYRDTERTSEPLEEKP